jgi:hypothetical protein
MFALQSKSLFTKLTIEEINQQLKRAMIKNDRLDIEQKSTSGRIWSNSTVLYGGKVRVRWVFEYSLLQSEDETMIACRYRAPYDNFLFVFIIGLWPAYQIISQIFGLKSFALVGSRNPFELTEPKVMPALVVFALLASILLGMEIYQAIVNRKKHEQEQDEILSLLKKQLRASEYTSIS